MPRAANDDAPEFKARVGYNNKFLCNALFNANDIEIVFMINMQKWRSLA